MKTKDFYIDGTDNAAYLCQVISLKFDYDFNSSLCNKELIFIHEGIKYKYVWNSSPSQGLSWLYVGDKCIYNPYHLKNEGTMIHSIARKLVLTVMASFVPKSAMVD